MPALIVATQALGEPRYPSLKGIMAARSKEIVTRSLADLGLDGDAGRRRGRDDHALVGLADRRPPAPRRGSSGRRPRRPPARSSSFLAERRLI